MRVPCSVPILTLNERDHLTRLLPLLVERFEDVFLIDGNSTDGTVEYAKSLGLRAEKQFEGDGTNQRITDFAAMRHRSWSMAKHPWVLWLDADEVPTPELLDEVERVVIGNHPQQVHRFIRVPQLPDGRIVKHGFYFPERIIRLFRPVDGIRLVDRPVHERFDLPPGIETIDHTEQVIAPWPSAVKMREKQRKYVELEGTRLLSPSLWWFIRWVVLYNLKSLAGQFLRAVRASVVGMMKHEASLPWSYNFVFFEYRWRVIGAYFRARRRDLNS